MTEPDILYPAIFVFSMMLIGLLLTVWEFSRLQKRQERKAVSDERPGGRDFNAARDKASGLMR